MSTLIDGYNLLHATGIVGRGIGPGSLERARIALLNFLAASLPDDERRRTTVVFDAHNAPPGRPRVIRHQQITVRFAAGHENADALIEELIRADSAPRTLVVVSSDHRVQRAAKRRRATPIDSDVWYESVARSRNKTTDSTIPPSKPDIQLTKEQVELWLEEFGGVATLQAAVTSPEPGEPIESKRTDDLNKLPPDIEDIANPFPPGYAEDLLNEDP